MTTTLNILSGTVWNSEQTAIVFIFCLIADDLLFLICLSAFPDPVS